MKTRAIQGFTTNLGADAAVVEGLDGDTYDDVFKPLVATQPPPYEMMPRSIWLCPMRYKGGLRTDGVNLLVPLYAPKVWVGELAVQWGRWPKKLKEVFRSLFVDAASIAEQRFRSSEKVPTVYFIPRVGETTDLVVDDYRKLCVIS